MRLFDELEAGLRLDGVVPGEVVQLVSVLRHGEDVAELIYRTGGGSLGSRVLNRSEAGGLATTINAARPFDADATQCKLAAAPGAAVKITVEIEATSPEGFDESAIRVVSENATTLKFEQSGFEEA